MTCAALQIFFLSILGEVIKSLSLIKIFIGIYQKQKFITRIVNLLI